MVMGMVNKPLPLPLPAITPISVLIRSSDKAPLQGIGTLFPNAKDSETTGLHVVSKKEAFARLDEWKQSQPERWRLVGGVALMQRAQREREWKLFQKALDSVQKWVPHIFSAEIEHFRDSRSWKKAGWVYSALMSNLLQTSRFIIWCSPKDLQPRPGLFCNQSEVAVYAVVGMDCIRICKKPGCGKAFIPGPNTQEHCPGGACANADRVARSKAKKKAREIKPIANA
jgi:hypothetical protein